MKSIMGGGEGGKRGQIQTGDNSNAQTVISSSMKTVSFHSLDLGDI